MKSHVFTFPVFERKSHPMCLQMVVSRGVEVMEEVLGWDTTRTSALLQACEAELTRRLQQVQAVQSIRSNT